MNGRSIGEIIENLNPKSEVGGVKELEERLQKEENSLALVNEIPTEGFIRWVFSLFSFSLFSLFSLLFFFSYSPLHSSSSLSLSLSPPLSLSLFPFSL